ncbi:MAG TPA: hypothetical protein VM184_07955 [Gaiellaceae bacterium]|nr:hypothetical protein [Gaiellaceae bacterium]
MRRLLARFAFVPVILILAGFIAFAIGLSDPPEEVERASLVAGSILPARALEPEGPFIPYVALHKGEPEGIAAVPDFPLDDRQPDLDGAFELSADPGDGRRYYLLARFETAKQERYCALLALPEMRLTEAENWVVASTGKPLEPQRLTVDKSTRCE